MLESHNSDDDPFRSLEQKRAFELILVRVEEAIENGSLKPGDRLPPERELAEMFGVGRTSLREALRALEMFGVISARRGRGPDSGSFVTQGTQSGLQIALRLHIGLMRVPTRDIVGIRGVLESFAAHGAAIAFSGVSTRKLRSLVDAMGNAEEARIFNELDTEFHVELAQISNNALLPVLMGSLRSAMKREMVNSFANLVDWRSERDRLVVEHGRIIALIESGDADGAASLAREHVHSFYGKVLGANEHTKIGVRDT